MAFGSFPFESPVSNFVESVSSPSFPVATVDAADDRLAITFTPRVSKTVQQVHFLVGTVAQATNGLRVALQDLSSNLPDGTDDAYRVVSSPTSDTITASGILSSDGTDGGTKKAVVAGTGYALVFSIENFQAGDDIDIPFFIGWKYDNGVSGNTSYTSVDAGSSWSHNGREVPVVVEYTDGTFELLTGALLVASTSQLTSNNSVRTYFGTRFRVPFRVKTSGAVMVANMASTARTGTMELYDSSNNKIASTRAFRGEANAYNQFFVRWAEGEVELTADAWYRVVFKATSGFNTSFATAVMPTDSDLRAANFYSGQVDAMLTHSADASTWTDVEGTLVKVAPLLSSVSSGGGGQTVIIKRRYDG